MNKFTVLEETDRLRANGEPVNPFVRKRRADSIRQHSDEKEDQE